MKTLLLALFLLIGFTSFCQTATNTSTIAQDNLKTFEDGWITLDYNALTTTQKQNMILTWVGLKVAVAKELDSNRIIAEAQTAEEQAAQLALQQARRQQIINYLLGYGFKCDNSKDDWYRLYNRPSIFGANWQLQADYQMSLSTGVDYFLSVAYALWKEFQKN